LIDNLNEMVEHLSALNSKLVMLVGASEGSKSALLRELGAGRDVTVLLVGAALGSKLAAISQKQRRVDANDMLRQLADGHTVGDLLLLDNIELLFDRTLELAPLDVLKHLARARRVVANWPGQLRDGRLTYAEFGHPEHQDYSLQGVVPFAIHE